MLSSDEDAVNGQVLVERILKGDRQAEAEMVQLFNSGLITVLKGKTRQDSHVDDLLQETWRIAIEQIRKGQLKNKQSLAYYINGIAKNLAITKYRSNKADKEDEFTDDIFDPQDDPSKSIYRTEVATMVLKIIEKVKPPRYRDLLMRFYIEQENKESLCDEFELSELHFNRVLFRARNKFKELWRDKVGLHLDNKNKSKLK